jgi:pSer/pThr/pTyr-binding forkhead associated (FHA) protein
MQVCSHCGKESRQGDTYCQHCGQRLATHDPDEAEAPAEVAKGWIWPWQRAGEGDDGTRALADPEVETAARAQVNGSESVARAEAGAAGRLTLTLADGAGDTRDFMLDGRNVTIGRAPACTVSLPEDQLASRLHAMLHYTGQQYTISDLGSSNGTLVNGALIRGATPLAEGDRITVGQHVIVYSREVGAQATPAVPPEPQVLAQDLSSATTPNTIPPADASTDSTPAVSEQEPPPPVADLEWTDAAAVDQPASATSREDEPVTAPLPAWQPHSTDPWVMPAPPQWAAGPTGDVWSAPQDMQPAAEPDSAVWARPDEHETEAVTPVAAASWEVEANGWHAGAQHNGNGATAWPATGPSSQPEQQMGPAASLTVADDDLDQGPATGELDALRTQLVRSTDLLSRWTQSATAHSRQLRGDLAALAQDVARTLAAQHPESLDELVRLAEEAAQDPHHVNTVMALATRSSDVARALVAQRELVTLLEHVQNRLAELARRDS